MDEIEEILSNHTKNGGLTIENVKSALEECLGVKQTQERILCAAYNHNGDIICGYRHKDCNNILRKYCGLTDSDIKDERKGFLTSHKRFVNRVEAYAIAKAANQLILKDTPGSKQELIFENVYWYSPVEDM